MRTEELRRAAMQRIKELCCYLLPAGRKEGHHWLAGSANGQAGAAMAESKVAQSVAAQLANPASNGGRHNQMRSLIMPLLEIGLSEPAIFTQFRGMYEGDLSDSEVERIIKWGVARIAGAPGTVHRSPALAPQAQFPRPASAQKAIAKARQWLDGFSIEESDLWDISPLRPGDEQDLPAQEAILALENLFRANELVPINTRYLVQKDGKVAIVGPGQTKTRTEWIEHIKAHGVPEGLAGAWIRLNPVRLFQGSGVGGAHCDADVAAWRNFLVESDLLPPELALSVYGKVALPIAAIIDSAGRSPHAWVTLNAQSPEEYAQKASHYLEVLATIGFDPGNSNPSRYGRLPGARRIIGARENSGVQRLLYLAPHSNQEEFSRERRFR